MLVDIVVRELANLPADDVLRADYTGFSARLLDQSEWATRGGRYREQDIKQATGGQSHTHMSENLAWAAGHTRRETN